MSEWLLRVPDRMDLGQVGETIVRVGVNRGPQEHRDDVQLPLAVPLEDARRFLLPDEFGSEPLGADQEDGDAGRLEGVPDFLLELLTRLDARVLLPRIEAAE